MTAPRTVRTLRILVAVLVVVGGAVLARSAGDGSEGSDTTAADATVEAGPDLTDRVTAVAVEECVEDTVPTVSIDDLPLEAVETLQLIAGGGPYPYDQDGGTFQNREGHLPDQPRGYYREYTVETPGSDDRGARRIVAGECGDRWYTDDHYDSFRLVDGTTTEGEP